MCEPFFNVSLAFGTPVTKNTGSYTIFVILIIYLHITVTELLRLNLSLSNFCFDDLHTECLS
jgi:hypothetical protein